MKQSRYLHDEEIEPLAGQIEKRKALQAKLRSLKAKTSAPHKKRNEVNSLKCTLMHKRIQVAELELDDATGFIQKIGTVYAPEHLPVGVPVRKGITDPVSYTHLYGLQGTVVTALQNPLFLSAVTTVPCKP